MVEFSSALGRFGLDRLDELDEAVGGHGLGPLERQAEGAVPDERGQRAEGARHAEEDRVVRHLRHAVVLQQDAAVGVHVGPRVLDLAQVEQDARHHVVELRHQVEHLVVGQVLQRKLALARVARVRLAQHRVAVTGHHLWTKRSTPQPVSLHWPNREGGRGGRAPVPRPAAS